MPSSRGSSHPGAEPMSPALQADSLPLSHWEAFKKVTKSETLTF